MKRNPVKLMDSVDALDLLARVLPLLRKTRAEPELIRAVREQKLRHQRALVPVIGDDEPVGGK
jgi:hypothetical protein